MMSNNDMRIGLNTNYIKPDYVEQIKIVQDYFYYFVYYLLAIINLVILIVSFYLNIDNKWTNFFDDNYLTIISIWTSFITLFSLILCPIKRKNNREVLRSFVYCLLGSMILQIFVCFSFTNFNQSMVKMRKSQFSVNQSKTLYLIDHIENVFYAGNCSYTNQRLYCRNSRQGWFVTFVNSRCIKNYDANCTSKYSMLEQTNTLEIFCRCKNEITNCVQKIIKPYMVFSFVNLIIDGYIIIYNLPSLYRNRAPRLVIDF